MYPIGESHLLLPVRELLHKFNKFNPKSNLIFFFRISNGNFFSLPFVIVQELSPIKPKFILDQYTQAQF